MRGHINESHPKIHSCSGCPTKFRSAELATSHIQGHLAALQPPKVAQQSRKRKRVTCEHCDRSLCSAQALQVHVRRVHSTEPRPEPSQQFICATCGKTFGQRYLLLEHERRHAGDRPFQCIECGAAFASSSNLASHAAKHRPPSLACPECDKLFSTGATLRAHRQSHLPVEDRRTFDCPVCGKRLLSAAHLRQHAVAHDDNAPVFECANCAKRFRHLKSLREHVQLHSGVKRHVCELCGKAYAIRHSLTTHRRTHDAPFRCQICGQIFGHHSSLRAHTKSHDSNIALTFVPQ